MQWLLASLKNKETNKKCVTTTTYQRDQFFFFLTEKMVVDRQTITVDGFRRKNFQVQVYHYYKLNWVQLE